MYTYHNRQLNVTNFTTENIKFNHKVRQKVYCRCFKTIDTVKTSVQNNFRWLSHALSHFHHWVMASSMTDYCIPATCQSSTASNRPHPVLAYDKFSAACHPNFVILVQIQTVWRPKFETNKMQCLTSPESHCRPITIAVSLVELSAVLATLELVLGCKREHKVIRHSYDDSRLSLPLQHICQKLSKSI